MSKDITVNCLLKSGFKEIYKNNNVCTIFELTSDNKNDLGIYSWSIDLTNHLLSYGRKWTCHACNNETGYTNAADVDIQTIDHFNKVMELMDINFRL